MDTYGFMKYTTYVWDPEPTIYDALSWTILESDHDCDMDMSDLEEYCNIYHQYTPNVSIYTRHGFYGYGLYKPTNITGMPHPVLFYHVFSATKRAIPQLPATTLEDPLLSTSFARHQRRRPASRLDHELGPSSNATFWLVVFRQPSEKYMYVSWDYYSQYIYIYIHVPNHQPVFCWEKT